MDDTLELIDSVDVRMSACFILLKDLRTPTVAVFVDVIPPFLVLSSGVVDVLDLEGFEVDLPIEAVTGSRIDLLESASACA